MIASKISEWIKALTDQLVEHGDIPITAIDPAHPQADTSVGFVLSINSKGENALMIVDQATYERLMTLKLKEEV